MRNIQYNNRDDRVDLETFVQAMSGDNQTRLAELQAYLGKALREDVTPRQQQVLFLYYVQGLNMRQIAEALKVERSTVSRTLKRGEERIRSRMRYNGGDLLKARKQTGTRH
ncbi:MAG: sigma-70 family RNA polymerase sigma factor [Ruminiclostridium sp.]|nr:sigma-70 family RNA polymerase sigma factor [Ruminiclostridium sp.]